MMPKIEFAIVDSNTLACMGLQRLLEDMLPVGEISVFHSFEELVTSTPERFLHFFVSSGIYFEHVQYFISQPRRSIVMVHGDAYPHIAGLLTFNVCQEEKEMVKSLLRLQRMGQPSANEYLHRHQHDMEAEGSEESPEDSKPVLSQREMEVALLLARGMATKEVADHLCISINTAMVHRRNIMEKLRARSLADIIVYVVRNGLISLEEL